MKNKIVAVLMASVLGVCTLAGCGSSNTQETTAEETTQTEDTTVDAAASATEEATEAVTEQSSTIAEIQPQTEVATEAVQEPEVTELPVVQTPSDARVAQVRASENAANDYFVIENGKHKRPDGRNASSICEDYGQRGSFGEVMGRYQETPDEIVTGWHNSATHYACMTSSKYNRVGVGIAADSEGYLYWVAIFMD